jgi:gamma-glutamylcyclotransferase (GGCT)/AIG2-like uncharacterized protein YtfP
MQKGDLVFVYGTLRKGERADLSRYQQSFGVSYMGPDHISGMLFHLGAYPGVKLTTDEFGEEHPSVVGEVFRILDASITTILDAYEGYPSLYQRSEVTTARGRKVWVYTYNHPVREEQLIIGGDWKSPNLNIKEARG